MLEYINRLLEIDEEWEKKVFGIIFRIQLCLLYCAVHFFCTTHMQCIWKCSVSVWPFVTLVC